MERGPRDAARNRRRFLAGSALALVATAGCLQELQGNGEPERRDPDPTTAVVEHPRIDEPPYEIVAPPNDSEEWNELYLCEYMPPGNDLEFQPVSTPRLTDPLLPSSDQTGDEYAVRVLGSEEAVREVFAVGTSDGGDDAEETEEADAEERSGTDGGTEEDDETEAEEDDGTETGDDGEDGRSAEDGEAESKENGAIDENGEADSESEEPIDEIDFEENVLVVVESGYGSGSIAHHWERAEATDRGFRLHGCYAIPYERTDDVTSWHSAVRVERPENLEFARVSLTTNEDERVHFNSTEGVVAIEKDV